MKYIRTKDGRIIDATYWTKTPMMCVNKENNLIEEDICYQTQWLENIGGGDAYYVRSESISHKNQVLNQADTIEELCDLFVVEDRDEFAIFHNLKLAKQTKGIIYGAIWCEWGLKYVAKMNEKGEIVIL